jgi:hypothetical protein
MENSSDNISGEYRPEQTEKEVELLDAAKKIVEHREHIPHHKPKKKNPEQLTPRQSAIIIGIIFFVLMLFLGIVRSCSTVKTDKWRITAESLLPATVMYGGEKIPGKVFAGLEAIRSMKDPALVSEIKKIIEEGGTPYEIFKNDVPSELNVASTLTQQFEIYQNNPGELETLRRIQPFENGKASEESLSKVSDVLPRVDTKRQQVRQMLNQPEVCFTFEFTNLPNSAGNQAGSEVPETKASDFLADYAMLEDFSIARSLLDGDVQAASESLAYIFRIAQLAAEVKNPVIRTKAGEIRIKAIDALQNIVLDPHLKEENLVYLFSVVQEQLNAWTPDSAAWIGDRASGMKVYNLVAQYGLDEALEPEEIEEMIMRGIYEDVNKKLYKTIAGDQVFYLQSMQKVIDVCREPYCRRMPVLSQIDDTLRTAQGTADETVIAEFLLRGIRNIMQYCAQDRTKCETAALAMAYSLQKTKYPFPATEGKSTVSPAKTIEMYRDCPLYCKKYEVQYGKDGQINVISVSYAGCLQPFSVPDFSIVVSSF